MAKRLLQLLPQQTSGQLGKDAGILLTSYQRSEARMSVATEATPCASVGDLSLILDHSASGDQLSQTLWSIGDEARLQQAASVALQSTRESA